MMFLRLISIILFLALTSYGLTIDEGTKKENLSLQSMVFLDDENRYTLEDINLPKNSDLFKKNHEKSLSYGYYTGTLWVKFSIKNIAKEKFKGAIEFPIPWIKFIDVYIDSNGKKREFIPIGAGYKQERLKGSTGLMMQITIESGETKHFIIKCRSKHSISLAPWLFSEDEADNRVLHRSMLNGGIIAFFIGMFFYNFILYIRLRDKNYLYYSIFLLASLNVLGSYYGFYHLYYPASLELQEFLLGISIVIFNMASILFVREFLETKKYIPKIDLMIMCVFYSYIITTILFMFFSDKILEFTYIYIVLMFFYSIIVLLAIVTSYLKKVPASKQFFIAYTFSTIGIIFSSLTVLGILKFDFLAYDYTGFSLAIDIVLFSYALVEKIRLIDKEKNKLKEEMVQTLKNSKEELEQKVEIRTKELEKQKLKAENETKEKSRFLAIVSHEIRTPLFGIIGLTELVNKDPNKLHKTDYLRKVMTSSKIIMEIINDVLDYSKIEEKKFLLDKREFQLSEIIDNIYDIYQVLLDQKNIELHLNIDENIPKYLYGDALRLQQVLNNLLSNAIKFSNIKSTIEIKILQRFIDENFTTLEFCVKDSGIGIAKAQQGKIFKSFVQLDNPDDNSFKGSGLGLVISKNIVKLMNGIIWLHSEKDKGSSFYFAVQIEYLQKSSKELENPKDYLLRTEGRVLLAEDNKNNQFIIKANLEEYGLSVDIANNGLEALKLVKENLYDIIFMDIQMPLMTGIEAIRKIRELNITIPIIVLSASMTQKKEAIDAGANEHLQKPIDWKKIEDIFAKILKVEYIYKSDEDRLNDPPEFDLINIGKIKKITRLSENQIYFLLNDFLRQYYDFDKRSLLLQHNKKAYREYLHKLKGSCKYLSFDDIAELIEKLENSESENVKNSLKTKLKEICNSIEKSIVPLISSDRLESERLKKHIKDLKYDIENYNFIELSRVELLLNNIDGIDQASKDMIYEDFSNGDYETLKERLSNLL